MRIFFSRLYFLIIVYFDQQMNRIAFGNYQIFMSRGEVNIRSCSFDSIKSLLSAPSSLGHDLFDQSDL